MQSVVKVVELGGEQLYVCLTTPVIQWNGIVNGAGGGQAHDMYDDCSRYYKQWC